MYDPTLVVETTRLILRPPVLADLDSWCALLNDDEAARYIGGVRPRSAVWSSMAAMAGSWALQGFGMFSVIEKSSGAWIGRLGPWRPEGWPGPEIGWALRREFWGRGYATEGATAAADWAFDNLNWSHMVHAIARDNARSRDVARRLGSAKLGPTQLPPPFEHLTIDLWGQSHEQWRARQR